MGENICTPKHQKTDQIIFFLEYLGCTRALSVCTIRLIVQTERVSFVGKILEQEKLEVKV